jgi:hypothetical protein
MTFITYLCWLLGITVPTECESNANYGGQFNTEQQCGDDAGTQAQQNVEQQGEDGKNGVPDRHSRRTNIDLSI